MSLRFNVLETYVEGWADERGIFDDPNPQAQLLKTLEELGEVAHALARSDRDLMIDGVGDVLVTLILFSHMHQFTLTQALEQAYGEIAGRKGKMVNGFFVKEE